MEIVFLDTVYSKERVFGQTAPLAEVVPDTKFTLKRDSLDT